MPQVAAGVALVAPDGQVLFVRRAGAGDHVGEWAFPGGRAEAGEDAETAARRECSEEVGYEPGAMRAVHRATGDAWDYTTHVHAVSGKFTPTLNDEHTEWKWADPSDGPQPQHPGVGDCLASDAWEESDHPRAAGGKFGSGGGGSGGSKKLDPNNPAERKLASGLMRAENSKGAAAAPPASGAARARTTFNDVEHKAFSKAVAGATKVNRESGAPNEAEHLENAYKKFNAGQELDKDEVSALRDAMADHEDDRDASAVAAAFKKLDSITSNAGTILANNKSSSGVEGGVAPAGHFMYKGKPIKEGIGRHTEVSHAQLEKLEVGKTYMIDGEKRLVTGKHMPSGKNAVGIGTGMPTISTIGFKKKIAGDEAALDLQFEAHDSRNFAFDKASVRSYDANGRLRIERANISKANVCGYFGEEIPGWEELGLDPRREYMMLRHPDALAAAAPTFNSVPILDKHVPSTAWDHPDGLVIGTTGSDAAFAAPYLTNSLVFWTLDAIEDIESKDRQELSCGYAYRPSMEPGEYEGVPYDGVMLDIIGNHIALVRDGRAGPDVIVGDSQPQLKETGMPKQAAQPTATAQLVRGALKAHLPTLKLAKDAKVDLLTLIKGVSKKTYAADKARIVAALRPKLAQDGDIDGAINGVIKLLDALEPEATDDDLPPDTPPGMDADPEKMIMDMFKAKGATDEEAGALGEALKKVRPAAAASGTDDDPMKPRGMDADEDDDEEKKKAKAGAMDEAKVKTLIHDAEQRTVKRMNATAEAREAVQPWVGKLSGAFDSAEGVYRSALDVLKVPHKGMHADALRPVLEAQPKPGEVVATRPAIVGDSADADAVNGFAKEFATHIRIV